MFKLPWSKSSDWLPLSNAIATVNFWETDLKYAKQWLAVMEGMKNDSVGFARQLKLARDDVKLSETQLELAKLKLEESKKLEEHFSH